MGAEYGLRTPRMPGSQGQPGWAHDIAGDGIAETIKSGAHRLEDYYHKARPCLLLRLFPSYFGCTALLLRCSHAAQQAL